MEEQGIFIERILSNENMNRAYKQVKKNKGAAGIDGMECADLLSHLKVNGQQLRESIRNQSYKPMPVKRVEIPKADGSKRKLGIPCTVSFPFREFRPLSTCGTPLGMCFV